MPITFTSVEHFYSPDTPFAYLALKGVDLDIVPGSMTAIIGHTGSGKSTLIQHLNALLLPTKGQVQVDEFIMSPESKPDKLKPLRQKCGLVFQFPEYQLFEETIEKDIMFGPVNFGIAADEAKIMARKALEAVGLDASYLSRSPFDLSGGQKRRVAIAGILVMNPDILVLDEPTAGLDPVGAKDMMELFSRLHEQGKTILLVSHDMNDVLTYCDRAVYMKDGQVIAHDTVANIFTSVHDMDVQLPFITQLIITLNKQGFHLPLNITDLTSLAKAIGGELK